MADSKQESDRFAEQIHAAPGTEVLFDGSDNGSISERLHQLKHRQTGDGRMLLVPQPSLNDPNDPLNWSTVKKSIVFFNGCWFAFMGAITGPIMAAGMRVQSLSSMILKRSNYYHRNDAAVRDL